MTTDSDGIRGLEERPRRRDIADDLISIADASRRADGSNIPLGEQLRTAADALRTARAERDEAKRKLFPYADAISISGMSWNGFYLIGDDKSIKELQRIEHRSAQLEQFSKAYDESVAREKSRAEAAEARLEEAKAVLVKIADGFDNDLHASRVCARLARAFLHQGGEE